MLLKRRQRFALQEKQTCSVMLLRIAHQRELYCWQQQLRLKSAQLWKQSLLRKIESGSWQRRTSGERTILLTWIMLTQIRRVRPGMVMRPCEKQWRTKLAEEDI